MQSSMGLIEDRIIFDKHADANFYSVWPFVFGRTISQIPQTLMDTLMFGVILYYEVGLGGREDMSYLFTFLSLLFVFALLMSQQLSVFASFANASTTQAFSACVVLLMMLFGGFIVAPDAIPYYYTWIYWCNPFAWVYRSLIVLEFRSSRWEDPDAILDSLGFVTPEGDPFGSEWISNGFFFMVPYFLACCVLTALGLSHTRNDGNNAAPETKMSKNVPSESRDCGVEIPFKPVKLSFHDICYEVTASTKNEKLMLLNSVNGVFRAGRMCALMGTSGAGKVSYKGCRAYCPMIFEKRCR
jgi:ABC-type multidrug transport system fused ATPase/permease subunit